MAKGEDESLGMERGTFFGWFFFYWMALFFLFWKFTPPKEGLE